MPTRVRRGLFTPPNLDLEELHPRRYEWEVGRLSFVYYGSNIHRDNEISKSDKCPHWKSGESVFQKWKWEDLTICVLS